jgi:cytochrome P450
MSKDIKINNVVFTKNTPFQINFRALHQDPNQWIEPAKFVPERFDSQSEWFKRPDGGIRNPLTFAPFLGGKRICLGKTFAEVTTRFTIPLLYHHFEFELSEETLANKPPVVAGCLADPVIPFRLVTKN